MAEPTGPGPGIRVGGRRIGAVWLLVGAGALFVGWRWWQARQSSSEAVATTTGEVVEGGPMASGVVGSGAGPGNIQWATAGETDATTPGSIDTNAEWTMAAVERLSGQGMDPVAVLGALGSFLARQPLDAGERQIVQAAVAAAGEPPQGRPWTVLEQVAPTALAAPTGLRAVTRGGTYVKFDWRPVQGAGSYRFYKNGALVASTSATVARPAWKTGENASVAVSAVSTLGKEGPQSAPLAFKK